MQKLPNCSGSSSLFHSSLSDQQITKSGWQPRFMCVSQHQILAGSPNLQPSDAVGLPGLPALSPCLSHHSYTEANWAHKTSSVQRGRGNDDSGENGVSAAAAPAGSAVLSLRSCCCPHPAGDAPGDKGADRDHRGVTQPHALGAKRSLHTRFLKGKNKSFPQLS